LGRSKFPTLEGKKDFVLGKGYSLQEGRDVALIACGLMVSEALKAAKVLEREGISVGVFNLPTLRPLDKEFLLGLSSYKGIVACEEHSIIGGLASAISETIMESYPMRVVRIGVKERFGQSGEPDQLLKEYGLTHEDIVRAARELVSR
jgi:transketolase